MSFRLAFFVLRISGGNAGWCWLLSSQSIVGCSCLLRNVCVCVPRSPGGVSWFLFLSFVCKAQGGFSGSVFGGPLLVELPGCRWLFCRCLSITGPLFWSDIYFTLYIQNSCLWLTSTLGSLNLFSLHFPDHSVGCCMILPYSCPKQYFWGPKTGCTANLHQSAATRRPSPLWARTRGMQKTTLIINLKTWLADVGGFMLAVSSTCFDKM